MVLIHFQKQQAAAFRKKGSYRHISWGTQPSIISLRARNCWWGQKKNIVNVGFVRWAKARLQTIPIVVNWCVSWHVGGAGWWVVATSHSVALIVHVTGTFRPKQAACHSTVRVCDVLLCYWLVVLVIVCPHQQIKNNSKPPGSENTRLITSWCDWPTHRDIRLCFSRSWSPFHLFHSSWLCFFFWGGGDSLQLAPLQLKWNTFNWIASEDHCLHCTAWCDLSVASFSPSRLPFLFLSPDNIICFLGQN